LELAEMVEMVGGLAVLAVVVLYGWGTRDGGGIAG
jgi:hypothetical protein